MTSTLVEETTVETIYGPVRLAFTGRNSDGLAHVHVSTDAHHNDDLPALTYRGRDYLISLHLYATGEGWQESNDKTDRGAHITRRGEYDYAKSQVSRWKTPTIYDALVNACRDAVAAYVLEHADVIDLARAKQLRQELERLTRERDELAASLWRLAETIAAKSDELASLS